jgi:hypothetical protein
MILLVFSRTSMTAGVQHSERREHLAGGKRGTFFIFKESEKGGRKMGDVGAESA